MNEDPLFSLPRTTRPADWFAHVLPSLPLRLPNVDVPQGIAYHVDGPGGGVWTLRLRGGRLHSELGAVKPLALQITMTVKHLREATVGALRDRLAEVLRRQGRPVALPDFSRLPCQPERLAALAKLRGSVALEISDREYAETYRYVVTFGDGAPTRDQATTTIRADADDLVALTAARTPPLQTLMGGKLNLTGDLELPALALRTLLFP